MRDLHGPIKKRVLCQSLRVEKQGDERVLESYLLLFISPVLVEALSCLEELCSQGIWGENREM